MKTRAENPWASSRTALVLYAQNYVAFLKNAVWLALFIWAMTVAVFLFVLGPAALIVGMFPGAGGPLTLLIALVLAWGIKQAVIEPIGMTALMQVFFKVTEGQVANPEWEVNVVVANRILVTVEGQNVKRNELVAYLEAIDFQRLATME